MYGCDVFKGLAVLNDIHLGHSRTPTEHIIRSLQLALPDNRETADLSMIILAGDVFERLLTYADECVFDINAWIIALLRLCKKNDIVLRVLEGTPSHDNKQSRWFKEQNEEAQIGADIEYIEDMTIEYIARFDIHLLYIPDEWKATAEITKQLVIEKMQEFQLEQVDFTIMHGAFPHQMPEVAHSAQFHDPVFYLSITRMYIFIGHIHKYSQYERIIAGGSLERLGHGEEEPKGHVRLRFMEHGHQLYFVRNDNAMKYVTKMLKGLNEEDAKSELDKAVIELRPGDHLRVKCRKEDPALAMLASYINRFQDFHWTFNELSSGEEEESLLTDDRNLITITPIHAGNIAELLLARVRHKYPDMTTRAEALLTEVLNE